MDQHSNRDLRPTIYCGDLAKLPAALQPLCARDQWVIWRLIERDGRWTKPPFRCDDPHRFASSDNPGSWSSYETAVAAAANGDGVSYILTPEDPFAAIDVDHVRDPVTGTIENWAQRFLDKAAHTYAEVSPSGTGLRIWGTANGETLHRKFTFDGSALELFRHTRKPLTVTGAARQMIGARRSLPSPDFFKNASAA
jgi:primase-polymerase (primpol)-like protein